MKIVSINVHYQDGFGYQDYYLGLEFRKMGHEIVFVSSDWHFPFPDYDRTARHIIGDPHVGCGVFENDYGAEVHRLKARLRKTNFIWLEGLFAKLKSLQPDLIISHGLLTWQTARLAYFGRVLDAPIIYDDHTHTEIQRVSTTANFLYFLYRRFLGKRIQNSAAKVVGITPETIPFINDTLGIQGPGVQMVPLGTNTEIYFRDPEKRANHRNKWEVGDNQLLLLYTGKIYPMKKAELLIEAANQLCSSHPQLKNKLVIQYIGDVATDFKNYFNDCISRSVCKVICSPAVSQAELASVYNGADIAIWPASATTSTIDASACGTPIIITNKLPERLEFNSGIGITPGDLAELTAALEHLVLDEKSRNAMSKGGQDLVRNKLGWSAIAHEFIKL